MDLRAGMKKDLEIEYRQRLRNFAVVGLSNGAAASERNGIKMGMKMA